MANNIIRRVWNQNRMVNIEDLIGAAFQAESGGHTFEISGIDDTGAAVALSGTVAGVFRRPDNADIALTGSASDGVVSVTLSEDCYAVPGRFGLTIFVTSNSQKVAVYACVGTVSVTSGGGVAGETPQDVVDLINAIAAAVATIPADYTDLMTAIAPTYSPSGMYPVGFYVWHDGNLYRCITPITTAETWTAAHWTAAVLGNDVGELKSAISTGISDSGNDFVWESGGIDGTGSKISNSARARMASAVECKLYKSVSTSDDLEMVVGIYNTSGVFQGYYNGTTTSFSGTWLQYVDLTGVAEYMVLIVCRLKATPSPSITPSVCNAGVTFTGVIVNRLANVEYDADYLYENYKLNSATLQSCDYYIDDSLKLLAGSVYTKTWYFKAKPGEYRIIKIKGAGYPYLITFKVARNTVGIVNGTTLLEVTKRIVNFEDDGYSILVRCEYNGYYYLYYGNNTTADDVDVPLFAEGGMLRNPASNVFGRKRIGVAKGGFQITNGRNNAQGDSPNHLTDRARTELVPVTAGSVIYSPGYQFIATIFTTGGVYSSNSFDNEAARWINEYTVANDCYVRLILRHPDDADITDLDLTRIANGIAISCYDEQNRIASYTNSSIIRANDGFAILNAKNAGKSINKDNFLVRGKITKSGNKIIDKDGNDIVLTGIGTHNLVEYQNLYTPEVFKTLVQYGINCIRLSVYLKDYRYQDSQLHMGHGYVDHPDELKAIIDKVIPMATAAGLYIILDWHSYVPSDGSALQYTTEQATFFTYFSDKYKAYTNILYEIQNEPYADNAENLYNSTAACASIIRANNADAILICGHGSDGAIAMNTLFNTTHDLDMFISPHLYTGSSTVEASIESCVDAGVPVFVTEWGNSSASGTSTINDAEAQEMFDYCHENGISYCVWKMTYQSMDTAVLTYNPVMANYGYGFGGWHDGDLSHNGHLYFDNIWQYHFGS